MKTKIICTSTGCLEYAPKEYDISGIDILRIHFFFQGKEYLEGIGFEPDEFYKIMENIADVKKELPHTAMPSYEEVSALFNKAIDEGYDHIVVVAISSYLGGTWNFIRLVAKDFQDKIHITVVDARITCFQEGLLALKAKELADKGADVQTIVRELEWMKSTQEFIGVAGKLDYMILNGRLKGGKAYMGKLMQICPVVHFNHAGELTPLTNAMGQTMAMKKADQQLSEWIGDRDSKDFKLYRVHTGLSMVEKQMKIEAQFPKLKMNHPDMIMSCITGCNIGPWVVGYSYSPIRREDEELPPLPEWYFEQHPEER